MTRSEHIVVGVDGSASSLSALDWATDEAVRRGVPLRVVHALAAWPYPALARPEDLQRQGRDVVDDAVGRARDRAKRAASERAPAPEISGEVRDGHMVPILLDEAAAAGMLVVGNRGRGGLRGSLLGSVSLQVASHADAPVVVVRGEATPGGPVVAGIDGSEQSMPALRLAFEEAALRGLPLRAVHCWTAPPDQMIGDVAALDRERAQAEEAERRRLSEAVMPMSKEFPDVSHAEELVMGHPGRTLVDASDDAALLVVGARGHGGFAGLMLGSVSHTVLHHADCPVMVVRPDAPA